MAGSSTKPLQARAVVSTPSSGNAVEFIDNTDDALGLPAIKRSDGTTLSPCPTTRTLTAGAGLTGGGTLAADRTFDVQVDGTTIEIPVDTLRVKDAGITLAKLANLATDQLIGRDTAGTGVPESISVSGGLEFSGAGA